MVAFEDIAVGTAKLPKCTSHGAAPEHFHMHILFQELKKYCEIMYFSGLYDKNGKEIYEGDIVAVDYQTDFGVIQWNGRMVFDRKRAQFGTEVLHALDGMPNYIEENKPPVIIGNVWENPELLNEPKKITTK